MRVTKPIHVHKLLLYVTVMYEFRENNFYYVFSIVCKLLVYVTRSTPKICEIYLIKWIKNINWLFLPGWK